MKNRFSKMTTSPQQKIALVLLGLILSLVLLEVGMRFGGFVLLSVQEYGNLRSIKQKGAYRILCLGESTTQRQYPYLLEQILNQRNIGVRFSVIDKGQRSINTPFILNRVESYLAEYHPHMVIAMMGSNDRGRHMPFEALTTSKGALFIRSLRIYKLTRLLWLHIVTKAKEMGFYEPNEDRRSSGKAQTSIPETGLKETSAENVSSEGSLEKAIEINPKNDAAYIKLGELYREQGKLSQAEDLVRKAIEINPKNDHAFSKLGWLYRLQGRSSQAEASFRRAIELNPKNDDAYVGLGRSYRNQGKYSQAEASFGKAIELNPKNEWVLRAMASLCEEMGKPESAKAYAKKANQLELEYRNAVTANNYRKLKEILDRKGIKLVCVQYPMRNVESLKRIFENNKGIIFVDNEGIFKDAVKKGNYKEYFTDMFGGDFGHCTQKGNELLAQNIADVILREVFNNEK